MKVTGLITEYNPFHNGHEYHIRMAKKITQADYVIAIMSGDFVQRGTPACVQKHIRAHMALVSGADLVLELPVTYATGTAERFAEGAVSILDKLGVVDTICFGSECGTAAPLMTIAHILISEPEWYRKQLQKHLKEGLSFPAARAAALPEYADILSSPNNILGIEYCKALLQHNSRIQPVAIQRQGSSYHEETLKNHFSSATAIRKHLWEETTEDFSQFIPKEACSLFTSALKQYGFLHENDFSQMLLYKLLQAKSPADYLPYADMSEELAARIFKYRTQFLDFAQFADLLKTKEITRTRINRALLHMILNITKYAPKGDYARILGFRKDAKELLTATKESSTIPLFSKTATAAELLNTEQKAEFNKTINSSMLYEAVSAQKKNRIMVHEYSRPIILV